MTRTTPSGKQARTMYGGEAARSMSSVFLSSIPSLSVSAHCGFPSVAALSTQEDAWRLAVLVAREQQVGAAEVAAASMLAAVVHPSTAERQASVDARVAAVAVASRP